MTNKIIRIGTRDSQLAIWQATQVQEQLAANGFAAELVPLKSEGDLDLVTPLYEMGVQGVFTKTLDAALLSDRFDIAVHSMKDVPTQTAKGIVPVAVLKRGSHKDLLVPKNGTGFLEDDQYKALIATSSIRRRAQWLHRFPQHNITNLRGNVNTRLRKLSEENWDGAIFAAAGLERTELKPAGSIELDWMLPAPAQGAILVVCREEDRFSYDACRLLNHAPTELCTRIERDFLRGLMGGCSTPISALASIDENTHTISFKGNIFSTDGKDHLSIELEEALVAGNASLGTRAAEKLLAQGAARIVEQIKNGN
ncbi:hydroxymethylbilane synthase [Flavihumibacter stibioxidans]|uniref:Hydroxymethylbilane synthase n=1 Tax=Flavihumibacter stibioxidans TaxID=1834163 RepID=A0ABR7M982_9BACT|nr:hydroxymethylbilane synthase [Flavihumibacter stibioxidans]MBC6491581.1 hydroxymethylbilane synthase [Flavihumibacter stibioxidans]